MKYIYLFLSVLGTVLPLSQFYGFIANYGLNFDSFFEQLFVNQISAFFALDVLISALVVVALIQQERHKQPIAYYWVAYIGLFFAGVSSGLPLFLYFREKGKKNQ